MVVNFLGITARQVRSRARWTMRRGQGILGGVAYKGFFRAKLKCYASKVTQAFKEVSKVRNKYLKHA
uniref:Uncharacterized protein n=1 Tax=Cucumis melo TaxID=3656 RepID=A0A9I9CYK8_CUCME